MGARVLAWLRAGFTEPGGPPYPACLHPTVAHHQSALPPSLPLLAAQGNRDNIDGMPSGTQKVLTQVLKLVDAHDLVGGCRGYE